jgi:hypothetical protein
VCVSGWFDFEYTLGTGGVSQSLTITHDDGIALFVGGVLETPTSAAGPTSSEATTFTMTGSAGQVVDLLYDECCGLPAVLTVNLPNEKTVSTVPEPTSIVLFGSALVACVTVLRRRRSA